MPVEPILANVGGIRLVDQAEVVRLVIKRLLLAGASDDRGEVIHERAEVVEVAAIPLELGEGSVELGRQSRLPRRLREEAQLRLMLAEQVAKDHLATQRSDFRDCRPTTFFKDLFAQLIERQHAGAAESPAGLAVRSAGAG